MKSRGQAMNKSFRQIVAQAMSKFILQQDSPGGSNLLTRSRGYGRPISRKVNQRQAWKKRRACSFYKA